MIEKIAILNDADGTVRAAICPRWLLDKGYIDAMIALVPFATERDARMLLETLPLENYPCFDDAMKSCDVMIVYVGNMWVFHVPDGKPRRFLLRSTTPVDDEFLAGFLAELFELGNKIVDAISLGSASGVSNGGVSFMVRIFVVKCGDETFEVRVASSDHEILCLQWRPTIIGHKDGAYDFEAPFMVRLDPPREFKDLL